jgi:hypothetical protein
VKPFRHLALIAVAVIALGFVWGLIYLIGLRFDKGDVYPVYSSLRSDPLGTRVLFESLRSVNGVDAIRNNLPLFKMQSLHDTTLLYFGEQEDSFRNSDVETVKHLEYLVSNGGRLVITFEGNTREDPDVDESNPEPSEGSKKEGPSTDLPPPENFKDEKLRDQTFSTPEVAARSIMERWGVHLSHFKSQNDEEALESNVPQARSARPEEGVRRMNWWGHLYFTQLDPSWRVLYERDKRPVIIERSYLKGSILLAADSYFVSNEALRFERHADLLTEVMGPSHRIIFEEYHLGFQADPSIATLARRYGFEGTFWGLLVLAILFIWRNSSSFIPASSEESALQKALTVRVQTDDSDSLHFLLRRNIDENSLPQICFEEWKKSLGHQVVLHSEDLQKIHHHLDARSELIARYQEIAHVIGERKRYGIHRH